MNEKSALKGPSIISTRQAEGTHMGTLGVFVKEDIPPEIFKNFFNKPIQSLRTLERLRL